MKRLLFLSTLLASLTLCAACSDDDDLSLEMTAADLEQTVWNAHKIACDGQGNTVGESFYILEFQTDETGKLTEMNADGEYICGQAIFTTPSTENSFSFKVRLR